jgi:hypothetical protein
MVLNRKVKITTHNDHWDNITVSGPDICFVCCKFFKDSKYKKVGFHKYTKEILYRHENCGPGSENWLKKFPQNNLSKL